MGEIKYYKSLYEADYLPNGTSSIDFTKKLHFLLSNH
jgi:hypothetical protein